MPRQDKEGLSGGIPVAAKSSADTSTGPTALQSAEEQGARSTGSVPGEQGGRDSATKWNKVARPQTQAETRGEEIRLATFYADFDGIIGNIRKAKAESSHIADVITQVPIQLESKECYWNVYIDYDLRVTIKERLKYNFLDLPPRVQICDCKSVQAAADWIQTQKRIALCRGYAYGWDDVPPYVPPKAFPNAPTVEVVTKPKAKKRIKPEGSQGPPKRRIRI
jgi:hypothetical protein